MQQSTVDIFWLRAFQKGYDITAILLYYTHSSRRHAGPAVTKARLLNHCPASLGTATCGPCQQYGQALFEVLIIFTFERRELFLTGWASMD